MKSSVSASTRPTVTKVEKALQRAIKGLPIDRTSAFSGVTAD